VHFYITPCIYWLIIIIKRFIRHSNNTSGRAHLCFLDIWMAFDVLLPKLLTYTVKFIVLTIQNVEFFVSAHCTKIICIHTSSPVVVTLFCIDYSGVKTGFVKPARVRTSGFCGGQLLRRCCWSLLASGKWGISAVFSKQRNLYNVKCVYAYVYIVLMCIVWSGSSFLQFLWGNNWKSL